MKTLCLILSFSLLSGVSFAQIGIGTNTPDPSAALDVSSSNKGLLVPHLTQAQRLAINQPATGLLVYQTNGIPGFYYNNGTPGAPSWFNLTNYTLQQNINTNGKYISANGGSHGLFLNTTGAGIGTAAPDSRLTLQAPLYISHLSYKNEPGQTKWHWSMLNNNDLNLAETGIADGRLYLEAGGNVGIGTTDPEAKLEVVGDVKYSGTLDMGLQHYSHQTTIAGNTKGRYYATCPSGTEVIGGGGGHRDANSAQSDIIVNYSGPDPANPSQKWRLMLENKSGSSRAILTYIICAKVK